MRMTTTIGTSQTDGVVPVTTQEQERIVSEAYGEGTGTRADTHAPEIAPARVRVQAPAGPPVRVVSIQAQTRAASGEVDEVNIDPMAVTRVPQNEWRSTARVRAALQQEAAQVSTRRCERSEWLSRWGLDEELGGEYVRELNREISAVPYGW